MMHVIHAHEKLGMSNLISPRSKSFSSSFMSPFTALREADKAAQDALSLVKTIDTIYKRLEGNALCIVHVLRHLSFTTFFSFSLKPVPRRYQYQATTLIPTQYAIASFLRISNDLDWVEPAVDRLNVAMFTKDVWSNNVQYDEAIANFFQLLIPRELHDQDDIVDLFIDIVTRWAVDETRWPIAMHTTKDVVNDKVRERIESDLKDEDPLLYQRILDAFGARFEQVCYNDRDRKATLFSNDTTV